MFDKILEKLNKLNEEEFEFEDIEIESKPEPLKRASKLDMRGLEIHEDDRYPIWQSLCRRAIQIGAVGANPVSFSESLEPFSLLFEANLLRWLTSQVSRGGFEGWIDNGYGFTVIDLFTILDEIGTETSDRVADLADGILNHLNYTGAFENEDTGREYAKTINDEYYNMHNQFCQDIEAFFRKKLEIAGELEEE